MKGFGFSINLTQPNSWLLGVMRDTESLETGDIVQFISFGFLIFEVEFIWNLKDE